MRILAVITLWDGTERNSSVSLFHGTEPVYLHEWQQISPCVFK